MYRLREPVRVDLKTIVLPSGDQIGKLSIPASNVNRLVLPASIDQISVLPCLLRDTATLRPSGATLGRKRSFSSGVPNVPNVASVRSRQVSWRRLTEPVR